MSESAPEAPSPLLLALQDVKLPTRNTAPFIYDIGASTLKGALIGGALGLIFFKGASTRRFLTYYGAGIGLGLNYPQARYLYGQLIGEKVQGNE